MGEYKILFFGDIVGRAGRQAVHASIDRLIQEHDPLFIIVNGENAASGKGITPSLADEMFSLGVDAITLGNHAFDKREIMPYLDSGKPIARPANVPQMVPGTGLIYVAKEDVNLAVVNLCGNIFMGIYDHAFSSVDILLDRVKTPHIFVDFHAEATSEKIGMGWHLAGRASAVVGTHTHVTTADEQILPGGTAYITDVGMCGPIHSIIGVDKDTSLYRFQSTLHVKFETAKTQGYISAVIISIDRQTGRARSIQRLTL